MDASSVDLTGGWSRIWEVLGPEVQGLLLLLMAIGVLIAVYATVKFVFDNRRRGGGDVRGLTVLLLIAALLRSEAHTSELQSRGHIVCRLLVEKISQSDQ